MTKKGHHYLLVAIDHFSRFSILKPLKDKTAKSIIDALTDEEFCKFTPPKVLISHNGSELNNQILNEVCSEIQINKCNVTT